MNVRAIAFGALVGFVVAFAPSCSPPKCGPATCGGCCDASNKCVAKPANANNTTCGSVGSACVDCSASGSTCVNNACTTGGTGGGTGGGNATGGGTGGGSATGGGGGTCDGCRLPTGACHPRQLSASSVTNCGINNATCQMCGAGEACTMGVCNTPMVQKGVGAACTADAECQMGALGANGICKKMTSTGNGTYTDGYCTVRCTGACPSGSTCIRLQPRYGEGDAICWDNCGASASDTCRSPGYACYDLGSVSACWLSPLPAQDAGTPADKVGNPCTADTQCQNPPETGGVCLQREFSYNWGANGGYCSKDNCQTGAECSADGGALCIGFTQNDPSICVQKCDQAQFDGGQSTCRNGYICEQYVTTQPDGGQIPSVDGFCVPPATPTPTSIGEPCNVDLDCSVPTGAIADCIPPTLTDGGASGVPGGECTRFGCATDDECGTDGGAACFTISATDSACFRRCAVSGMGQSTCRTDFVCQAYRQADGGLSADGVCNPSCAVDGGGCAMGTCNAMGYCQ